MKNAISITEEIAREVMYVVDQGLTKGVGEAIPGQMCVEAAVCYALGEPHGDEPSCVAEAVRVYKIAINDCDWSSKYTRSVGLRRIAVAQLGSSHGIDEHKFADYVTLQTIKYLLPNLMRSIVVSENALSGNSDLADKILKIAKQIEGMYWAVTSEDYKELVQEAKTIFELAYECSSQVLTLLGITTTRNLHWAVNTLYPKVWDYYIHNKSSESAFAAGYAAAAIGGCTDTKPYLRKGAVMHPDQILTWGAEFAVEALQMQNCEGCKWLWITENSADA